MKIFLTGETGGIGSAIKEMLSRHEFVETPQEAEWLICAHGFIDENDVEQTFVVNTILSIRLTQQVLLNLKPTGGIIYISSASGIRGNTRFPAYSASKAALNSYATTMARKHPELSFYAVCPGPTNTKMWQNLGIEGKTQEPSEVAEVVKDILDNEYKSGDIITIRNGEASV